MIRRRLSLAAVLAAFVLPAAVQAATPACAPPPDLAPWPATPAPPEQVQRGVTVATYLLTLSWAPEWCRTNGQGITAQKLECSRPTGFILHGLWPNGVAPPYPRYCNPVGAVPLTTVRRMYCRTPSPELIQHEWAAHGACSWTDPQAYFARAAQLYDRIARPPIETIAPEALTAGAVRRAFMAKNPWLQPTMIYVQADREQRLTEVRLCYDLAFKPRACIGGAGAPDTQALHLTPSLTGAF